MFVLLVLLSTNARAATLLNRSIAVATALTNSTTTHQFKFDYGSLDSVGSVVFEYCDSSPLFEEPCIAPDGLDASNATLLSQSGQTGFSMSPGTTANSIIITRPTLSVVSNSASYTFGNVVNASTPNKTIFVRISTHASDDGSGNRVDSGAVAFTLSPALGINAFVPPFLTLCSGVTVTNDCSSSNGLGIDLGTLNPSQANTGTTQLAAATNDAGGYILSMQGTTATSGNNIIPALASPTIASPGTGQFGINLRANTKPISGRDPEGVGTASPTNDYNNINLFTFRNGDTIATSDISTDFNRFTVSYLLNIPFGQAPGVYSTTITYIAVAAF